MKAWLLRRGQVGASTGLLRLLPRLLRLLLVHGCCPVDGAANLLVDLLLLVLPPQLCLLFPLLTELTLIFIKRCDVDKQQQ